MGVATLRNPTEYESRLERYLFERSEEWRAVRVGEKEVSEQAEIVERYRDLFTREQLDALEEAERASNADDRERLYRLRKTCEAGIVAADLAGKEDEFENRLLAQRVELLAREEVGVAAHDLRLLRDLLLAHAHRAPLLRALEQIALEA